MTYAQKNIPEKSSTKRLESQDPGKDNIYGWQIMTDYERDTYKQQIITLKKQHKNKKGTIDMIVPLPF